MKATLLYQRKVVDERGNIIELVIWKLPKKTADRPHGIKYRCYYGDTSGNCIIRYDNETGKGDHKHVNNREELYSFRSVEQLMKDFFNDIRLLN